MTMAHSRPVIWRRHRNLVTYEGVDEAATSKRAGLIGPLPTHGIWTALALTRNQFVLILAASVVLFVFVDGPLWRHLHSSHFTRITVSYAVIPLGVAAALYRNGHARLLLILVASAVLAVIKLVVTAGVLVAIGVAQA